ncbi:unnamed protein product [Echinostoma caproni]|uniref:Protein tweety homolog n=1 Tax=Echinostoma caproni TaxID=27848 RepID=A0A183ARJ3_9TREM|nr:unnamed protein product [Echinostoma caproni]
MLTDVLTYAMTAIAASDVTEAVNKTDQEEQSLISKIAKAVSSVRSGSTSLLSGDGILTALIASVIVLLALILLLLIGLFCCTTCFLSQDDKNGPHWFSRPPPPVGGDC